jgi:hypothetical protein
MSGVGILQYLQAITPRMCLGAEVMHQKEPAIPGGSISVLNLCARYTGLYFILIKSWLHVNYL